MPNQDAYGWRKALLIPFWLVECAWAIVEIGVVATLLTVIEVATDKVNSKLPQDREAIEKAKKPLTIASGVLLGIFVLVLLLTVAEMVLYCAGHLKPLLFIGSNTLKTAFWLAVLIVDIIGVVKVKTSPIGGWVLPLVVVLCFLAPLLYGFYVFISFHRSGPATSRVDRDYTSVVREGPSAGPGGAAQLTPFINPNDHSGKHTRDESGTEMGLMSDTTPHKYENLRSPAPVVGATGNRGTQTGNQIGLAGQYHQPYSPDGVGGYGGFNAAGGVASAH